MNKYKYKEDAKGTIINIKHGALKEGPGWRSIVYFKGCNFYCLCVAPVCVEIRTSRRRQVKIYLSLICCQKNCRL